MNWNIGFADSRSILQDHAFLTASSVIPFNFSQQQRGRMIQWHDHVCVSDPTTIPWIASEVDRAAGAIRVHNASIPVHVFFFSVRMSDEKWSHKHSGCARFLRTFTGDGDYFLWARLPWFSWLILLFFGLWHPNSHGICEGPHHSFDSLDSLGKMLKQHVLGVSATGSPGSENMESE
jgi:hypothetical protein